MLFLESRCCYGCYNEYHVMGDPNGWETAFEAKHSKQQYYHSNPDLTNPHTCQHSQQVTLLPQAFFPHQFWLNSTSSLNNSRNFPNSISESNSLFSSSFKLKRTPGVLSRVVLQAHPSFDNNNCGPTVPAREMSHRSRQKGIQTGPLAPGR